MPSRSFWSSARCRAERVRCDRRGLARSQIKVMMREFLRRYPNVESAGQHRRMRSDFVNGIKYLPVRLNA